MNPLQRAIASAAGLDDVIDSAQEQIAAVREQAESVVAERESLRESFAEREAEYTGAITELQTAQEQIYSDYTLLQRRFEDIQFIDWSTGSTTPGGRDELLSDGQRAEILRRVRILRHENPLAKQAIKITARFVFGKSVTFLAENDADQQTLLENWNDPQNTQVFTGRDALISAWDDTWTDGERFMVMVSSNETPFVRYTDIPVEQIKDILYDPGNRGVAVWYKRVFTSNRWDANANGGEGRWVTLNNGRPEVRYYRDFRVTDAQLAGIEKRGLFIPERKVGEGVIKHIMVNPIRNARGVRRGLSELFASREWFRVFREFMQDRVAINAAANALAYQRRIKGGPVGVARVSGALGGVRHVPADDDTTSPLLARLTRPLPGSIVDSSGNDDLRGIRLDTGAPNAVQDVRLVLVAAGAGVGIPINYFGETSASLAGAQTVELPLIKMFEDHQSSVKQHLQEIAEYIVSVRDGEWPKPGSLRIAWEFPPIVTADLVKWITAFAQFSQQVAPGNNAVRRIGIRGALNVLNVANADMLMDDIDAEEDRLQAEKEAQRKLQLEAAARPPTGLVTGPSSGGPPHSNGNSPSQDGQKVGGGTGVQAINADVIRGIRGRPPREKTTGPRSARQ